MITDSPLRTITRLDRIRPEDLYYAVDTQLLTTRFLHLSGEKLTTDSNYAWYGTRRQFRNLCKIHGWDALSLINRPK